MAASGALLGGTSLLFSMQLPVQADGPTLFQKIVEISDRLERVEDALGVEDLENERLLKLIQKARVYMLTVDFQDLEFSTSRRRFVQTASNCRSEHRFDFSHDSNFFFGEHFGSISCCSCTVCLKRFLRKYICVW